jgi:hypothetical protein
LKGIVLESQRDAFWVAIAFPEMGGLKVAVRFTPSAQSRCQLQSPSQRWVG